MEKHRLKLKEGITPEGTPDSKYYAFDWDDNIVSMPTKIVLKNEKGEEVGMSTEDFAHYRGIIGKEEFDYNGEKIVGFAEDPFRNFSEKGDKQFVIDALIAKEGPAWNDFVEAINNGSIFAIVTARGHTPSVLKEATYNYIVSNHNGLDSNELVRNLRKYRDIADEEDMSDSELIREYLNMCKFYPVSYRNEKGATNPEQAKIEALEEFTRYVRKLSHKIQKKAFMKNKISNFFVPKIGFSDDDLRNVEKVKSHFEQDPKNIITTYSTAGGRKKKF